MRLPTLPLLIPALQGGGGGGAPSRTAVRDTVAAVFRQRAYDRALVESIWSRFWRAVLELLDRLFEVAGKSPLTRPIVMTILVILGVLLVGRLVIDLTSGELFRGKDGARSPLGAADPWLEAQRLATAGRYTDAAHALYAALLRNVAAREDLRLHPSKTVGDYLRELRHRSSTLMPMFRDFARSYEVVVWGLGFCDRDRYERLCALAAGMLPPQT